MRETLERLDRLVRGHRVAVVGVGNRARGDDGVGSRLAERLRGRCHALVLDAETVPENHLGPLLAAAPEAVVFVDAADHGGLPGALCLVPAEELAGRAGSTHGMSLLLLSRALAAHGIASWLVGIQPGRLGAGTGVCPAVTAAALAVEDTLARALGAPEAAHA